MLKTKSLEQPLSNFFYEYSTNRRMKKNRNSTTKPLKRWGGGRTKKKLLGNEQIHIFLLYNVRLEKGLGEFGSAVWVQRDR